MEKTIICIGREYGSGGHEIGELLAKRTGYAFYDKEKLFEIAKMRGYEKEMQEYLAVHRLVIQILPHFFLVAAHLCNF